MKSRVFLCAGIIIVMAISWAQAQQSPPSIPSTSTLPPLSGTGYAPQRPPSMPPQAPAATPPGSPYTQRIPGEVIAQDPAEPHYPYPPYPNPFYDGGTRQNPLYEGMDWLRELPSQVVQRVNTFLDTTLFPKRAATHGGATPPTPSPPASNQSLPRPFAPQAQPPQAPQAPQAPLPDLVPGTR